MDQQDIETFSKIIAEYEERLSWKRGGGLDERLAHVLSQFRQIADNSIYKTKAFAEDVKTQFKALEIITEGISSEGMNHGQKRTIANYVVTMLRDMVDKIDKFEYEYSTTSFERFNFFRSHTPERRLHEAHKELKYKSEAQEKVLATLKEVHPDIYKSLTEPGDIPF